MLFEVIHIYYICGLEIVYDGSYQVYLPNSAFSDVTQKSHWRLQIRTWLFFCSCCFPRLKKVIEKILIVQMKLRGVPESAAVAAPSKKRKYFPIFEKGHLIQQRGPSGSLRNEWSLYIPFTVSQIFVRPPQTTILPFCISFSWGWSWSLPPVECHEPLSIVLQAIRSINQVCHCLSIPRIYFSLPLYNHKGFDLGHTWMV